MNLFRLQFFDGPGELKTIWTTEDPSLMFRDDGERFTFCPPVQLAKGDSLWSDMEGRYWLCRGDQMRELTAEREPYTRSQHRRDLRIMT